MFELRSTPGSTSLGPAFTSSLASTGQALEFLASTDLAEFVKVVKSVPLALQDAVADMEKSGSKRASYAQSQHSDFVLQPYLCYCSYSVALLQQAMY